MEFNIADLFECVADAVPAREAVVCGDDRCTYAELDERATRLAHALRDRRRAAGDHVGLYLRNSVAHLEAMLACYKARAVPINVNYRYVADELALPLRRRRSRRAVPRRRHDARTSTRSRSPALLLDVDRRFRRVRGARAVGLRDARLRPALRRRPLRALHRRHHRPAEGRGVAPGGHVLRRARQREPGRPADHRTRADRGVGASTTPRNGCARSSRPATRRRRSSCRSRSGR